MYSLFCFPLRFRSLVWCACVACLSPVPANLRFAPSFHSCCPTFKPPDIDSEPPLDQRMSTPPMYNRFYLP
uniref:Putative secreted protein n=1 Tax=Anopheles marajoara TaxID=58244 RepID=A0A2M4CE91_9DIPT